MAEQLQSDYPWTQPPLVVGAPMRLIALAKLACEVSIAGGLGFIGVGSDASILEEQMTEAKRLCRADENLKQYTASMPIGVGFLLWAGDKLLNDALPVIEKYKPAAVWLFAPRENDQLVKWSEETRRVTGGHSKIWIQVGTVAEAERVVHTCQPDVLVVQGTDAGGHGLEECAGLFPLFPEVEDAVTAQCRDARVKKPILIAAGGIIDGRGVAGAVALGASGVTLGTRYLASPEANIAPGYRNAVLKASDGGVNTARGKLYDSLRGTTDWPDNYGGRSVLNHSWHDAKKGMGLEENKRLYDNALMSGDEGWGDKARLTTYAGTGVGLVKEVQGAAAITAEVREDAKRVLKQVASRF